MKDERIVKTYVCIIEFGEFDPNEFSALYTRSRRALLGKIAWERARMQSAAAELAYLAAARAALENGAFVGEDTMGIRGCELKDRFEYCYAENGRPLLEGACMSLSHTEGAAMAAVSSFGVGVDIERERHVSLLAAKRILNASEYAELIASPEEEKNGCLLEAWTAKESFLKLTGEGLSAGLDKLHYEREKAVIIRGATGERAFVLRADIVSNSACETQNECVEKAAKKLFACICQAESAETVILRFFDAADAAEFILNGSVCE